MENQFLTSESSVYLVLCTKCLSGEDLGKLSWLLRAEPYGGESLDGEGKEEGKGEEFLGPRVSLVSPWSTNAVEICQNVGISSVCRIERFRRVEKGFCDFDPMLETIFGGLRHGMLEKELVREEGFAVESIRDFNREQALSLSEGEIAFLEEKELELGRKFTDCEVFSFSQINSEHCRHKIFNGQFSIDGKTQEKSLFRLIKDTTAHSGEGVVSAYSDNVAFFKGPPIQSFSPKSAELASNFSISNADTVLSLKAETHNFPTTVEAFYGASTGSGGEIRDRLAGGCGSLPLVGSAVYMTSYPELAASTRGIEGREWKYQTPEQILIRASDGASDFGNKFGQPLVVGSLFTFEGQLKGAQEKRNYAYDRVVMLAGGVGYTKACYAHKKTPQVSDKIVLFGGDNYRIGMAGSSVSSADGGSYAAELELSAIQRANPEMQKRIYNAIRALVESKNNFIVSVHDHGAGGHINCFSELVEESGGFIDLGKLPIGDPTLSAKEIIANESQERMGLIFAADSLSLVEKIAKRERTPFYVVGEVTNDKRVVFSGEEFAEPFNLPLDVMFGSSPKTLINAKSEEVCEKPIEFSADNEQELKQAILNVLSIEAVACKDWLTNKVDRSVSGLVASQQCVGPKGLPLANLGVSALDYRGERGVGLSLGHAPVAGLVDEKIGSRLSVAEALTNLVWAPLSQGLSSVFLSANWMWPAGRDGEDARLYRAVEALSDYCIALGIAVPTGKDSLSMTMHYGDQKEVRSPGTVVVSASAEVSDVKSIITPDIKFMSETSVLYVPFSESSSDALGGSSLAQSLCSIGSDVADVCSAEKFALGFEAIQELIPSRAIVAGHDVSSGGVISALLEMAFSGDCGLKFYADRLGKNVGRAIFSERPGVLLQVVNSCKEQVIEIFSERGFSSEVIAEPILGNTNHKLEFISKKSSFKVLMKELFDAWYKPSFLLDDKQVAGGLAKQRFSGAYKKNLYFVYPEDFSSDFSSHGVDLSRTEPTGLQAAIIREKGTNGDREMAFSLYAAGFDVKDITMVDLAEGKEDLSDIKFAVFPGGFSNSDVLGAARGWAGVFRYNDKARTAIESFYARNNTLSLGVCNGCQLMSLLDVFDEELELEDNDSKKFESNFLSVDIKETNSVMLKPLIGSTLGIWLAHGEGKFVFPNPDNLPSIPIVYSDSTYPENPNGSQLNAAAVVSKDGRHLAMMPHLERSVFPWQWAYHGDYMDRELEISPWMLAFVAARDWLKLY